MQAYGQYFVIFLGGYKSKGKSKLVFFFHLIFQSVFLLVLFLGVEKAVNYEQSHFN